MGTHLIPCYRCNAELSIEGPVSRRDACQKCGTSIHACKFCHFYDRTAYNECREPSADRVVDKEKENFCDYFTLRKGSAGAGSAGESVVEVDKKKLDDLFK